MADIVDIEQQNLYTYTVDKDLRTITIPKDEDIFGVVGDIRINRVKFEIPRYCAGYDLSEFTARVDYVNAHGDPNYYEATNFALQGEDTVIFTWEFGSDVTAYKGTVVFGLKIFKLDGSDVVRRFKTQTAEGTVLDGMDVESYIDPEAQKDLLMRLEEQLDAKAESIIEGSIQDAVDSAKKKIIDETSADKNIQQITKNKEDIASLKEDLTNENIFDKTSSISGYRLAVNGSLFEADNFFTSDYIGIQRGLAYKKNSPIINVYHRMCLYNTDKKFIASIDDTNDYYNNEAAYIRFCGLLTEIDTATFKQSNANDAINRKNLENFDDSFNELKKEIYENIGYYKKSVDYTVHKNHGWESTGVMAESNTYDAVEINVKEGQKIAFAGSFGENAVCMELLYDEAAKNRLTISGDFDRSNLFYHEVSSGVTKILLSVRNQNNTGYKFDFEFFINSVFECKSRLVSQCQLVDAKFYSTAHQGYVGYGAEENTLQAFVDACETGKFNCIETDARLTSDNIFVLWHNESIVSNGETFIIKEKTYQDLKKIKSDICTLEECMKICKRYGLYLLIDKLIYSTVEENVSYLFPLIRKYRMQDNIIFSSAVSREEWTKKILEFNPRAKVNFYYPNEWFTAEQLAKAKSYVDGKNEIIITCGNSAITEDNLQLFYANCDGVKIGTSVQQNLDLYKSLFYTMDYIDSNLYGSIDCF